MSHKTAGIGVAFNGYDMIVRPLSSFTKLGSVKLIRVHRTTASVVDQ